MTEKVEIETVSKAALERIPKYYYFIKGLQASGKDYIASSELAKALKLNPIQVRKDLATIASKPGKPRRGFYIDDIILDMENFLGYNRIDNVILVGAGRLGQALLAYDGFKKYGFNVVAAFDKNPQIQGQKIKDVAILPLSDLKEIVEKFGVKIGVITLPRKYAQIVCDKLVKAGIKGILNFTQFVLDVPEDVVVQDVNMVASLAILSKKLKREV